MMGYVPAVDAGEHLDRSIETLHVDVLFVAPSTGVNVLNVRNMGLHF